MIYSPDSDSLGARGGMKLGTSSSGFFKNQIKILLLFVGWDWVPRYLLKSLGI
jgi:hypothetical protein